MGQQQLLLIVLGVILVGVAVVLGIKYFGVGAESGAKDELVAHVVTISAQMQEYYKKPTAMGGGGNSFLGFVLDTKMDSSATGTYSVGSLTTDPAFAYGLPIPAYNWHVKATVTDSSVITQILPGRTIP